MIYSMFLDVGLGIVAAILVSRFFGLPVSAILIVGGILFALLPDIDFLFHLSKGGSVKSAHEHRDIIHQPLLYIPLGVLVINFWSGAWAALFGLASVLHFLHDSIGIGWGVQWLYPFSRNHYAFLYRYRSPKEIKEGVPTKLFYVWKDSEVDELAVKYGDREWVRNIYLKWHPYAIAEFVGLVIAIILLYLCVR